MTFQNVTEYLPEGAKGAARVKHIVVSEREASFSRVREVVTGGREQAVQAGRYAQLFVGHTLMMSDTSMERTTNTEFVRQARGNVLVAGLGLGMILVPILKKPEVTSVLVVELYPEVIDLVGPSFQEALDSERLTILADDIFKIEPPVKHFDTIYFDIWPEISTDNLEEMSRLHKRFKPSLRPKGWMESWMRKDLEHRARRGF